MGSHMRSMLPRLPPFPVNHCVNVMSSNARTISARAGNVYAQRTLIKKMRGSGNASAGHVHAQRTLIKKCADPGT